MYIYIKMLVLVFSFIIVPFTFGLCVTKLAGMNKISMKYVYVTGLVAMLALYEIIYIPLVFLYSSNTLLTGIWLAIVAAGSILGIIGDWRYIFNELSKTGKRIRSLTWQEITAFILVAIYIVLVMANQQIYEDDTIFAAWSETAYHTNSLIKYSPYTGKAILITESNMPRYLFAGYSVFIASISRIFNLEPVIVMHQVIPLIFIPVSYVIYYMIARLFTKRNTAALTMIMLVIINSCSIYTLYELNSPTWMYVGMWYGKALIANFIVPLVWYYGIVSMDKGSGQAHSEKNWINLFMTGIAGFFISTFGSIAVPSILTAMVLFYSARNRTFANVRWYIITIMPAVIVMVITQFIK